MPLTHGAPPLSEPQDTRIWETTRRARWAEAFRVGTLDAVLQGLYDNEINVGFQAFWDGGWTVWIGDEINGHAAGEHFKRDSFGEIADWLKMTAEARYPKLKEGRSAVMDAYG